MYMPPECDFQPDDGEPYDYEPDITVWRLAGIVPLGFMALMVLMLTWGHWLPWARQRSHVCFPPQSSR